ncbi:MAG: hypothetical protein ACHQHO_11385 [Solirubrobacterales bacterium]
MARSLRVEQQLTVDELAARLSLPRSTIYYWVRDLPLRGGGPQARGDREHRCGQVVSRVHSEAAYDEALETFEELSAQPTFRDFVCIYLVQGEQRDRTRVALTNSDPAVMRLVSRWLRRLTDRAPLLSLQCEPGQSLKELRRFWGEAIGAEPRAIRVRGSGAAELGEDQPPGPPHGLLTVAVDDTLLRARLHGWMHRARESWR